MDDIGLFSLDDESSYSQGQSSQGRSESSSISETVTSDEHSSVIPSKSTNSVPPIDDGQGSSEESSNHFIIEEESENKKSGETDSFKNSYKDDRSLDDIVGTSSETHGTNPNISISHYSQPGDLCEINLHSEIQTTGNEKLNSFDESCKKNVKDETDEHNVNVDHSEEQESRVHKDSIAKLEPTALIDSNKNSSAIIPIDTTDNIWWMDFLEKESLFDIDTTNSPLDKQLVHTDTVSAKSSLFPPETLSAKSEHSEKSGVKSSPTAIDGAANDDEEDDDEDSVLSLVADEDVLTDDDWQERLWIVARQHGEKGESSVEENEDPPISSIAALSNSTLLNRDEHYRNQILRFRNQLSTCLEAYVEVFHDYPSHTTAVDDDQKTHPIPDVSNNRTNTTNEEVAPNEDGARKKTSESSQDDTSGTECGGWPPAAIRVSPYVPVPVVKLLFREVIHYMDSQSSADEAAGYVDESSISQHISESDSEVDRVMRAFLSTDSSIFRAYTIQPLPPINEDDNHSLGSTTPTTRKRVRKETEPTKTNRQDIEDFLYGDMYVQEEKKSDEESDDVTEEGDDTQQMQETSERQLGLEEEIRLRGGVIAYMQRQNHLNKSESKWTALFSRKVLIHHLIEERKKMLPNPTESAEESLKADRPESNEETESLAFMYAIRYLPHFLLRTVHRYGFLKAFESSSFQLSLKYFCDKSFLRDRLLILGIYNGVMVHMEELDAFFDAFRGNKAKSTEWQDFHSKVNRSVMACLESLMMENMGRAGFFTRGPLSGSQSVTSAAVNDAHSMATSTKASGVGTVAKWDQAKGLGHANSNFDLESGHPQIVSSCLEIGRSLHFLGVSLGRQEQERLSASCSQDTRVSVAFDEDTTDLEVSAYRLARSSYQGALKTLKNAEVLILSGKKRQENADAHARPLDVAQIANERKRLLEHIREARVTIELYLGDTLTTFAYCQEAKLKDYSRALQAYRDALSLYARHVGKNHDTVIHTLRSMGHIYVELQKWHEALRSFNECLMLLRRRGMTTSDASREYHEELATVLKSLGEVFMELSDYDTALERFEEALENMQKSLRPDVTAEDNPVNVKHNSTQTKAFVHPFICEVMSKLASITLIQASEMKVAHYKNRLEAIYVKDSDLDENTLDNNQVNRLQLERQAIEWLKESVTIRRQLREQPEKRFGSYGNADDSINFAYDLLNLGKLHFCRCEYSSALSIWTEAGTILETFLDKSNASINDSYHPSLPRGSSKASEIKPRATDCLIEIVYLLGKVYSRLNENDKALIYFGDALGKLKQNLLGNVHSPVGEESQITHIDRRGFSRGNAASASSGIRNELDIGHCEYSIGLTYLKDLQFEKAIQHFQGALGIYSKTSRSLQALIDLGESDLIVDSNVASMERLLELTLDFSVAKVKQSLGLAYNALDNEDEATQNLSASADEIHIASRKMAVVDIDLFPSVVTCCSSNGISLFTSIVLSGDAHRRLANISLSQGLNEKAMLSFEAAIQFLELENTRGRMAIEADDECEFERFEREKVDDMLMNCYGNMLKLVNNVVRDKDDDESSPDMAHMDTFTREDILFRMGSIYAQKSLYGPALECYLEAKTLIEEKLETSDHKIMGHLQFNLGNIYRDISKASHGGKEDLSREKAIQCFDESLRISRLSGNYDALNTADILESLGALHMVHSDFKRPPSQGDIQAIAFFRDAIDIRQKTSSTMTLTCAQAMHSLGVLLVRKYNDLDDNNFDYRFEVEIDEAIELLTQSVRVRKTVLGDHPAVANTIHCLGKAFYLQSKLPQVRGSPVMKNALQHSLEMFGDAFYIRKHFLGSFFEGKDVMKEINSITADGMGIYDAGIATIQNLYDMGLIHGAGRKYEDAMNLFTEAISYLNKFTKRCHDISKNQTKTEEVQNAIIQCDSLRANIFFQIACIHESNGKQEEAIQGFEESLNNRGISRTKNSSADTIFRDFLDGQNVSMDLGDSRILVETSTTAKKLARAYAVMGKVNEALQCYGVCLCLSVALYGERSRQISKILGQAGKLYHQEQQFDMCVRLIQKAFSLCEFNGDDSEISEEEAILHMRLGQAIMSNDGENKEALHSFNTAVASLEELIEVAKDDHRRPTSEASTTSRERLLLECYSAILLLMRRESSGSEEDKEEIAEVMHHIGNLQASLQLYDEAIVSFSSVLEIQRIQKGDDHLSIADLLFNLGNIFLETGNLKRARECHEECHRITALVLGEPGIELAENMICMGHVEFRCGDYQQALEWYDGAIRLLDDNIDGQEASIIKVLQRKGIAHDKVGDHDKAIESFGEVLKLGRKIWGRDDLELSNVLNALGNAHRNRLEFARALRCYEESLRIRLKAGEELSVANTKNNIGAVLVALEQNDRAKAFYADALRIKTKVLGKKNTETARTLFNLGQLYVEEKANDVGLRLLREALQIFRINLGSDHYEVGACLHNIAIIHGSNGEISDALECFRNAVEIFRESDSSHSMLASSLHHIGVILFKRNCFEEAKPFFSEALELKLELKDQDEISDTQYYFATLLSESGDMEQSLDIHRRSLDGRRRHLVDDHPDVANSLYAVSQLLIKKGLHDDALDYIQECYEIRIRLFGPDKNETINAALSLCKVYREIGRLEECSTLLSQILQIKISLEGTDSLSVADVAFRLGIVLCEMGKFANALDMYNESLRIRLLKLGSTHEDVCRSKENIGIVNQEIGNHTKALEFFKEALEAKPNKAGKQDERIGAIQHAMAKSYAKLGDFDVASRLFTDVITKHQSMSVPQNIEVARVLLDYADVLDQRGEFEQSLQYYDRVLDLEVLDPTTSEVGNIHAKMGSAYLAKEEYMGAFDSFKEAAQIFEGCLSKSTHPQTEEDQVIIRELINCYGKLLQTANFNLVDLNVNKSRYYSKIAHSLVRLKDYERAADFYRTAIDMHRQTRVSEFFIVASNLHNLGNCLYQIGGLNEALTCLQEALMHFRKASDVEDVVVADTYHCLGLVHHARSDYRDALLFFDKTLKVRRKSKLEDNSALVSTLYNMGLTLYSLGMYEASLKSCGEALRLSKTSNTSQTLLSSDILACIALNHKDRGEYEKSLKCLKECLRKRELVLGGGSLLVGTTLYEIGLVCEARGESISSQTFFTKSLANLETIAPILSKKFTIFQGDKSEASDVLTVELESARQSSTEMEENPIKVAETVLIYSTILGHHERYPEAIKYCEDALGLLREKLSPDHTTVAEAYFRLGFLHFQVGRFEESLGYVLQALQLRTTKLGEMHPDVEMTARLLGQVYGILGHTEDALHYLNKALKWKRTRKSRRAQSSSEIQMLIGMGKLHLDELELDEALVCFTECMKLHKQSHDDADIRLAEILYLLGSTLFEKREYTDAHSRLTSAKHIILEQEDEDKKRLLWKIDFSLGQLLEEQKSYEEARDAYNDCLEIIQSLEEVNQCSVAQALLGVGRICIATENFAEGLSVIEDAKASFTEVLGPHHLELATCWYTLGVLHRSMKNHTKAKECFKMSLQIGRRHLDKNNCDLYESLQSLGACLSDLQEYIDARNYLEEALQIGIANEGPDGKNVGETHRYLAHVQLQIGELSASLEHFERSIAIGMSYLGSYEQSNLGSEQFAKLNACFEAAIPLAKPENDPERLGRLYYRQGILQTMNRLHKKALKSFTEALRLYKTFYGDNHVSTANALFNIGVCLNETGDPDRAVKCLSQALHTTQSQLGDDHIDVADTLQQLAVSYKLKSDFEKALEYCNQAMRRRKNKEDSAFAALLDLDGQLNVECEKYDEAERCFRESIRVKRNLHGGAHLGVADSLFSLGYVYETFQEDFSKALRCYEECLYIRKSNVGDTGVDVANSYLHLGCVHASQEHETKAIFCFGKVIMICSAEDHEMGAIVDAALVNKGQVLYSQGKCEEALECFQKTLDLRRKWTGKEEDEISEENADVFRMKALVFEKLAEEEETIWTLNLALAMYKATLGDDHLRTATTLQLLADHYLGKNNHDKAFSFASEALEIRKKALGDSHEDTGDSYFAMGTVHFARNEFEQAQPFFEASLSAFIESRGELHITVADSLYYIACIHELNKNTEQAIQCFQGSLSGRQYNLGNEHGLVADVFFKLGMMHQIQESLDLAAGCFRECLKIRIKVLPEDHIDIGDTHFYFAGVLFDNENSPSNEEATQHYIDAIRVYNKHLGENHVSVAKCLASLGNIFEDSNDLVKAGSCYQRAIAIFDQNLDEDPSREDVSNFTLEDDYQALAGALLDWATYLDRSGQDSAAMKAYHRAMKLYNVLLGADHEIMATILCNIANLLGRQERYDEAMSLFDKALKMRVASFGEDHPSVADLLLNCGVLHSKNCEYEDAIATIEESLHIRRSGGLEAGVAEALTQLGIVQGNSGDFSGALESWDESLSIYKQLGLPDEDPRIAEVVKHQIVAKQMINNAT